MVIGERLRELRKQNKLTQGDIEKRTGILKVYISRVENGHTVPTLETLERLARGLEIPLYQFFYDGEEQLDLPKPRTAAGVLWGSSGKEERWLVQFRRLIGHMGNADRRLLLSMVKMLGRVKA